MEPVAMIVVDQGLVFELIPRGGKYRLPEIAKRKSEVRMKWAVLVKSIEELKISPAKSIERQGKVFDLFGEMYMDVDHPGFEASKTIIPDQEG